MVIPTPLDLAKAIPLEGRHTSFILRSRKTIEAILLGHDPRLILVMGPCSIHDQDSVFEYARRLKALSVRVENRFFIVMRTYFEKPRTGRGWKGFLYDPDLNGSYNIAKGLSMSRKILKDLCEMGVPTAAEFLEINTAPYIADFLSWGCIGARTVTSQPHRQLVSNLPLPVGFKNSTDGNVLSAINGILSAQAPHVFLGIGNSGRLERLEGRGNPLGHLILRGGDVQPNYDPLSIAEALHKCRSSGIGTKIFVDCSHGNSGKCAGNQVAVFDAVMRQQNPAICGLMLESHLSLGAQVITEGLRYGVSVTDPCLDWEATEEMISNHFGVFGGAST